MSYAQSRQDERARTLEGRMSLEDGRRKREQTSVSIRKNARRNAFQKRRMLQHGQAQAPTYTSQATTQEEKVSELNQLVAMCRSNDLQANMVATFRIRGLLSSQDHPPIAEVMATGIVPRFVEFLSYDHHTELQFEAAWALTNIASGTQEQTHYVLDLNAVPKFIHLLKSPVSKIREQAVWALGNIAGDSVHTRDFVLSQGIMEPLLQNLSDESNPSMTKTAAWALSNLCRRIPQPDWELVKPSLPVLAKLLHATNEEVLTDTCWTLSYLSNGISKQIQAVVEVGVVSRLVGLLQHPSYSVITPALRTIGNIVTGDERQTGVVLNNSALPPLLSLLGSDRRSIRKEACWTFSNIAAGNPGQIDVLINSGAFHRLANFLQTACFEVKREAAWAFSNAISGGTDEQVERIVATGFLGPLLNTLQHDDSEIVIIALGIIEALFKIGTELVAERETNPYVNLVYETDNGHKKIEAAQDNPSEEVFESANHIVLKYLSGNDDQTIAPYADEGGSLMFGVDNQATISFLPLL